MESGQRLRVMTCEGREQYTGWVHPLQQLALKIACQCLRFVVPTREVGSDGVGEKHLEDSNAADIRIGMGQKMNDRQCRNGKRL